MTVSSFIAPIRRLLIRCPSGSFFRHWLNCAKTAAQHDQGGLCRGAVGVAAMVLLTAEAAHHWLDAVLWDMPPYFVFEWLVRCANGAARAAVALRALQQRIVDAIGDAMPSPSSAGRAQDGCLPSCGCSRSSRIPALRRVLVVESGRCSACCHLPDGVSLASSRYFLERASSPFAACLQRCGGRWHLPPWVWMVPIPRSADGRSV